MVTSARFRSSSIAFSLRSKSTRPNYTTRYGHSSARLTCASARLRRGATRLREIRHLVSSRTNSNLLECRDQVFLDGPFTDAQTLRDHLVRVSLGDQFRDFALTRREHRRRRAGLVAGAFPAQTATLFCDAAPIADAQIDCKRFVDVA